jgi:hypothetical protein
MMSDILRALLSYESCLIHDWRQKVIFFTLSLHFPICFHFESNTLYDKFVPLIFQSMHCGALPVKQIASTVLCTFIRTQSFSYRRTEMCTRLLREFGQSRSYWDRMIFLDTCIGLIDTFSARWIKKNLYGACLQCAQDPVANVRRKFCTLLPLLKQLLRLPLDNIYFESLNKCIQVLKVDIDQDVRDSYLAILSAYERIDVSMEYEQQYERENQLREDEEDRLIRMEQDWNNDGRINNTKNNLNKNIKNKNNSKENKFNNISIGSASVAIATGIAPIPTTNTNTSNRRKKSIPFSNGNCSPSSPTPPLTARKLAGKQRSSFDEEEPTHGRKNSDSKIPYRPATSTGITNSTVNSNSIPSQTKVRGKSSNTVVNVANVSKLSSDSNSPTNVYRRASGTKTLTHEITNALVSSALSAYSASSRVPTKLLTNNNNTNTYNQNANSTSTSTSTSISRLHTNVSTLSSPSATSTSAPEEKLVFPKLDTSSFRASASDRDRPFVSPPVSKSTKQASYFKPTSSSSRAQSNSTSNSTIGQINGTNGLQLRSYTPANVQTKERWGTGKK